MYSLVTRVNNTVIYLKVAMRLNLKCSNHMKKNCSYVMRDVNTRLIAVIISQYIQKSLYYISEINMLHVNYISI